MRTTMYLACAPILFASSVTAYANSFDVAIEIPAMNVAEYHRPYVALWIEDERHQVVSNLVVWYDGKMRNNEGEKWLKDMRQWWRRSGRTLTMPVDGVSGATKAPGQYELQFVTGQHPLTNLAAGNYRLQIEAAREVGGRELLSIPFTWPASSPTTLTVNGEHELGRIALTLKPE